MDQLDSLPERVKSSLKRHGLLEITPSIEDENDDSMPRKHSLPDPNVPTRTISGNSSLSSTN